MWAVVRELRDCMWYLNGRISFDSMYVLKSNIIGMLYIKKRTISDGIKLT